MPCFMIVAVSPLYSIKLAIFYLSTNLMAWLLPCFMIVSVRPLYTIIYQASYLLSIHKPDGMVAALFIDSSC